MRRGRRRRAGLGDDAPPRPLCVLLLPERFESSPLHERAEDLLAAPGAVAVEPGAMGYRATGRLPRLLRERIAAGQARRMLLPGRPRAIVAFDAHQYPLARALLAEHPEAELWYAAATAVVEPAAELHAAASARAALTFGGPAPPGVSARTQNGPLWERMEALGIDSGRLGSERLG